jgi:hypothetical protein
LIELLHEEKVSRRVFKSPTEHGVFQPVEAKTLVGHSALLMVKFWMLSEILKLFSKTTDAVLTIFRIYRWAESEELKLAV